MNFTSDGKCNALAGTETCSLLQSLWPLRAIDT